MCLVVLATLLLCDAWFDVTLDVRTSGFLFSLLSALLIEIPLAALRGIDQCFRWSGGGSGVMPEQAGRPPERLSRLRDAF